MANHPNLPILVAGQKSFFIAVFGVTSTAALGDWDDIYGDGCSKYLGLMDPQFGLAHLVQTPITITDNYLVGGIPTPLKRISQLGVFFPIYGKM